MRIDKVRVYGLPESVAASKYPMSIDTSECTEEITDKTRSLGSAERGSGHDQFLTGIIVQFDLTFSIKAWVEAERYGFLDFVSSQSTMHRIERFSVREQCNEYVTEATIQEVERLVQVYNDDPTAENRLYLLYNVPVGFQLTARMSTNYRQFKTIYFQRRNHRLPEWRKFCKWIVSLPHFCELCLNGRKAG